jgi:hypothetical protein
LDTDAFFRVITVARCRIDEAARRNRRYRLAGDTTRSQAGFAAWLSKVTLPIAQGHRNAVVGSTRAARRTGR